MMRELCEAIHNTLPHPRRKEVDVYYTRAVLAAVAFVECVTRRDLVYACEWSQQHINGHCMYTFEVTAVNELINQILDKMFENYALFSLTNIKQNSERGYTKSTCVFNFSSYIGLKHNTGINYANDCTDHDAYTDNLSEPLGHIIFELMNAHYLVDSVHPDSIRWFADRLPTDEIRGPHILALQNFLYRRAN